MWTYGPTTWLFLPLLALAVFVGARTARARERRTGAAIEKSGLEGSLISLYSLLLSFGFFLSGSVHRDDAALVHDQCGSLARLWRESSLLAEPDGEIVRAGVVRVLELEVRGSRGTDLEREATDLECRRAYDELWSALVARARDSAAPASFRAALDEAQTSITLDYRLRFHENERMPRAFLVALVLGALLISFLVGFTSPRNSRLVPVLFVVIVGGTIVTMLDLNDPRHGFLLPSHANFEQLWNAVRGG